MSLFVLPLTLSSPPLPPRPSPPHSLCPCSVILLNIFSRHWTENHRYNQGIWDWAQHDSETLKYLLQEKENLPLWGLKESSSFFCCSNFWPQEGSKDKATRTWTHQTIQASNAEALAASVSFIMAAVINLQVKCTRTGWCKDLIYGFLAIFSINWAKQVFIHEYIWGVCIYWAPTVILSTVPSAEDDG